jgi:hypothetical protein
MLLEYLTIKVNEIALDCSVNIGTIHTWKLLPTLCLFKCW